MQDRNFKAFIDEIRSEFQIAIDDLFNAIEIISEDLHELKMQKTNSDAKVLPKSES
ncbi:MAG: hypothetical protein ACD_20C00391G0016 [uncultured bacterium]|nr:MAG: hypothetical protein ACD_20C00391G0016 [uncultured bacterium]